MFKAKGTAFLGALAAAERAPGGLPAVKALMPPERAAELEPLYVAHVWYDLELLIALMTASAEIADLTLPVMAERAAVVTARQDIEGMYKHALRSATPRQMAKRLPRAFNRYFSPSKADLIELRDSSFSVRIAPIPTVHQEFFMAMNQGFARGALETTGATTVSFEWTPPSISGRHVAITFLARWAT